MVDDKDASKKEYVELQLFAIKRNSIELAFHLAEDMVHLSETGTEEKMIALLPLYARVFFLNYCFLLGRHEVFCKQNDRQRQALRITGVFYVNKERLSASNVKTFFIRRDALWIYGTALLELFLREVDSGNIELGNEDLSKEELQNLLNRFPVDWVEKFSDVATGTRIMQIGFAMPKKDPITVH